MTEPYLKAVPDPAAGLLRFEMDAEGFALFKRLIDRAEPRGADNPAAFAAVKARVEGAFMAGAVQMGWSQR